MLTLRRCVVALGMAAALSTTGCDLFLRLAVESIVTAQASAPKPHGPAWESDAVMAMETPLDRPFSECEKARGNWREKHQDQDEPPPELRCLGDGSYPPAPRKAASANTAAPAAVPAASSAASAALPPDRVLLPADDSSAAPASSSPPAGDDTL